MTIFETVAQMKLAHLRVGQLVQTKGYTTAGDGGGATYLVVVNQAVDELGDHTLANTNVALVQAVGGVHRTFETVAEMVASTGLRIGNMVRTLGYTTSGDGGGNEYKIVAAATGTDDGGEFIDLVTHQAQGLFLGPSLAPEVSPLQYGARMDGVTPDHVALQALEDMLPEHGAVLLSGGQMLLGATINLSTSYRSYRGRGSGVTEILRTNGTYGDTFSISHATPATNFLLGIVFDGIKIRANVEMNSGAHIHLQEVTQSTFHDVFLEDGFVGYLIEGGRNIQFSDSKIESGKFFSTLKTGSRFVRIAASPNPAQENTELGFNGFNWTFTINATIDVGLEIEEMDGAWFSNGHILGAKTAECLFDFGSSAQLTGARFSNVWFDGFTDTNLIFSNAPTGAAKDFVFSGCTFSGADVYCVQATATAVFEGAQFTGCSFENCDAQGVKIGSGSHWQFSGCKWTDIDRLNAANGFAIQADNAAAIDKVVVNGCDIGKDATLDYGVRILNTGTEFVITGNSFEGVNLDELGVPTTAELNGHVSGNNTDRTTYNNIAVATSMVVPAIAETCNVTGTTGTIETVNPRWEGRNIVFRGQTASHTMAHGAGNVLNQSGAGTTLSSNRAINYQYIEDGNAFYQIG